MNWHNPSASIDTKSTPGRAMLPHAQRCSYSLIAILLLVASMAVLPAATASAGGWSDFLPSPDSRIVYVSSSQGYDGNTGLAPDQPVRTLQQGFSMLRSGYPDWLLLRRGDIWENESFGEGPTWNKGGRSEDEPIRLSAYGPGPDRPIILATGNGFTSVGASRSHVAITGIHFKSAGGGNDGIRVILGYGQNWLIEDCKIEGFKDNINIQGSGDPGEIHNLRIRRSVIVDAAAVGSGHSQGMYVDGIHGLLIEECVFDHNGWSQDTDSSSAGYATIFNHNIYVQTTNVDATVRGNIVANASSHGIQLRCGGEIENNLFVRNSLAILLGGGDPNPVTHTNGVTGSVVKNVVLDGKDINPDAPRGFAIDVSNIASATVAHNIMAHNENSSQPRSLTFQGSGYGSGVGVNNTIAENNIAYDWGGAMHIVGSSSQLDSITLDGNHVQTFGGSYVAEHSVESSVEALTSLGNHFHCDNPPAAWFKIGNGSYSLQQWMSLVGDSSSGTAQQAVTYPDPDRTLADYHASIGAEADADAFLAEARQQSRSNWRPEYTAEAVNEYIREGFGMQE